LLVDFDRFIEPGWFAPSGVYVRRGGRAEFSDGCAPTLFAWMRSPAPDKSWRRAPIDLQLRVQNRIVADSHRLRACSVTL
jgi:hypothetical protein